MKNQTRFSHFFICITLVTITQSCQSMSESPSSPKSPKTLFVYDSRKNNYLLFKLLKKTPHIIDTCIKKVHESETLESWQTPRAFHSWRPAPITISPATIQGCYMEFCDDIPRALITPWGRQPFFNGTTYNPFVKKMIPFLLTEITISPQPHPTATSCWQTNIDTHPTTFFDVITLNNVLLESPALRKTCSLNNIQDIMQDWNTTVERYEEEQEEALIKKEINAFLSNSPVKTCMPIKNRKKD